MTAVVDVRQDDRQPGEPREQHDRHDRRTAARERRSAHVVHGLTELLERRPELATTCPLAAFAADAVRWTA
ncbi:MAG TPA: hypothetical protein VFV40_02290 [Nocardioides sp.]|nr:hypothetical protein [Nocardioides sp.]